MILHFSGIDIVYLHLNHIGSVAIDINSCLHIDKLNYFNNSSPSSQSVHELSLCCTEFFFSSASLFTLLKRIKEREEK